MVNKVGGNVEGEQLSFLELTEKQGHIEYDATICDKCLCNKCKYNAESSCFSENERKAAWRQYDLCFNCDECFYYGMDDESLSKNIVRFKCEQFKMLDCYVDLEAKERRKKFKVI